MLQIHINVTDLKNTHVCIKLFILANRLHICVFLFPYRDRTHKIYLFLTRTIS